MSEGEPEVCSAAGSSLAAGAACSLVCSVISWSSVDAIAQFRIIEVYLWLSRFKHVCYIIYGSRLSRYAAGNERSRLARASSQIRHGSMWSRVLSIVVQLLFSVSRPGAAAVQSLA